MKISWCVASLVLLMGILGLSQQTLVVPDDHPTIQAAIDAASFWQSIFVESGVYNENLVIRRSIVINGEAGAILVARDENQPAIAVGMEASNVFIGSFAIQGGSYGVVVSGDAKAHVHECTLSGNFTGVGVWDTATAILSACEIRGNQIGVLIAGAATLTASDCRITDNFCGIDTFTRECGYGEHGHDQFEGRVQGSNNSVTGNTITDFCPRFPGVPWPDGFADEENAGSENDKARADLLVDMAIALANQDEYELAWDYLLDAQAIYDELRHVGIEMGRLWLAMGNVLVELSSYESALRMFEQAVDVFSTHTDWLGFVACAMGIGRAHAETGRYEEAISWFEDGRSVSREQGLVLPCAKLSASIGTVYLELGQLERAMQNYLDAYAVSSMAEPEFQATLQMNMGVVFWYADALDRALDALGQASEIFGQLEMRVRKAEADANMGLVYRARGDLEEAKASSLAALEVFRSQGMWTEMATAEMNAAIALEDLGHHQEALDMYDAALSSLSRVDDAGEDECPSCSSRWLLLYNQGRCYESMGLLDSALESYVEATQTVESLRKGLRSEELKAAWQERTRGIYERLIDLLYRMGKGASAFPYAERCRARTFLDLVAAGPAGTLESVAEEGLRSGVVDASVIEADLAEVVAALPPDTAAVEYFVADEATYAWVVRDGSASTPIRIEITEADLRQQILAFRTAIETTSTKMSETPDPEEGMETMSRDLCDVLIAPVEYQLDGIDHLIIVPSGPLYYLPFCALMDCLDCEGAEFMGGEYLVERYSLSYAPSLTTLKYAWAAADEVRDDPLFLALADPDSGDARFPRLVSMQREATAVAALFDPSEVHVAAAATEEVVTSHASSADQLLLSTHGTFNPLNPMFSYLLLSPTDESDGRLYTYEIFSLDLHAALVTLSACETLLPALEDAKDQVKAIRGESDDEVELTEELLEALTAGDEIVGLTRALLYAGTSSVLSTLWQVVSETTEPLMVAFYGYLREGMSKADALREAQLYVMKSYPHPRYWAAFELMGDWRACR